MNVLVVIGVFILLFAGAAVITSQTKMGYLRDLEKELGIAQFKLTGNLGNAKMTGVWKSCDASLEVKPRIPGTPSDYKMSMVRRGNFAAIITPGVGLSTSKEDPKAKESEEQAVRPWRVKLTDEEQKIIDQRNNGLTEATIGSDGAQKFNVSSNKTDEVVKFLRNEEHSKALEDLFHNGFSKVEISMSEIVATKMPYYNDDMMPKKVESYLKAMKALVEG